jgi:hypothetical protein
MAKLLVYLDDDFHADVKELAHRKKTTMAALVRYALDYTFEDELDVISGEHSWEEYLRDPSSAITLDDYLKERGIVLPDRNNPARKEESATGSRPRRKADSRGHRGT